MASKNSKYRALANVIHGKLQVKAGQVVDAATLKKFPEHLHNRFQEITVEVVTAEETAASNGNK